MDKLKECAVNFAKLFDKQYKIILGKKGKETEIILGFDKKDFHHLIGLQYLKDLPNLKRDRAIIFDEIIDEKITYEFLTKSEFFEKDNTKNKFGIKHRIEYFVNIEDILDSNNLVFKYSKNRNRFSFIEAEYLFKNFDYDKELYVFIDSRKELDSKQKFCRSFFPRDTTEYSKDQMSMTIIYKEKINLTLKESIIQINELKK